MGGRRPGHQVGQEGARGHRGGEHPGHPPSAGPAPALVRCRAPGRQRDRGQHHGVDQRVDPEELAVRVPPHLLGGVAPGQGLDRRGERTPVAAGEVRADGLRRNGLAQPAEHGRGQVGEHHQARLPGGGRVEQSGGVAGAVGQGKLQVRRLGRRARRGDQERGVSGQRRRDPGEFGVGGGELPGPFGISERAQVHHGQRAAGQHRRGDLVRCGQVGGDVAGLAGQRERGAGADGGGAARGLADQQAPVGVVVELVVVGLQRGQAGNGGARAGLADGGEGAAGGVGVVGLGPGARVQREPAVGRAGQRQHRVVHQVPRRALAGQPPQGGRPGGGHVAPAQPGQADDDHVLCSGRRGAGLCGRRPGRGPRAGRPAAPTRSPRASCSPVHRIREFMPNGLGTRRRDRSHRPRRRR